MHELTVGQKVICKHKNGRYYQCDVVQLSKETFYEVNFDDGSFSDNLFPEDIVVGHTHLSRSYHSKENSNKKLTQVVKKSCEKEKEMPAHFRCMLTTRAGIHMYIKGRVHKDQSPQTYH